MANKQIMKITRPTDGTAEQNLKAPKAPVKYQMVRTLGERDLSINHLMKRLEDGVRVVFKTYKTPGCVMKGQMPLEVYILKEVLPPHPLVINCQDYSLLSDGKPQIFFDYYEGGDLDKLFRRAGPPLPENLLWHVFIQMADALAHLHHGHSSKRPGQRPKTWQPVVHAAVEPSNIFCRQKYRPGGKFPSLVLGNFSMAFVGDSRFGGGELSIFQPPECPSVSAQTDVWGLGATIHSLAHNGETTLTITDAARKEIPSANQSEEWTEVTKKWIRRTGFPKGYSDELKGCMDSCLKLDKGERIQSKDLVKMLSEERDLYEKNGPKSKKAPKK